MPIMFKNQSEELESPQPLRWRYWLSLWLAVAWLISALFLTGSTGHLAKVDQTFDALYDARAYLLVSDYLSQKIETIPDHRILLKPILYPAFLSLRYVIGIRAVVFLQLLFHAASIFLVSSLVAGLTRSKVAATIAAFPLILNVTLVYFAFFAMTEPLAVTFSSLSVFLLARHARLASIDSALHVMAALTFVVCIKPAFLPALVFWTIYVVASIVRRLIRNNSEHIGAGPPLRSIITAGARRTPLLLLVALPILVQIGFSYRTTESFGGWSVASNAFGNYLFPVIYGYVQEGRIGDDFVNKTDPLAAEAKRVNPETADKVRFVLAHPLAATRVGIFTLFNLNITQKSRALWMTRDVVPYESLSKRLTRLSGWINLSSAAFHVIFLFIVPLSAFICADSTIRRFLLLGFTLAWLLLGPTALTYWGGDRFVTLSLPVWASVYAVSAWVMWKNIWPGFRPVERLPSAAGSTQ